MLDLAAELHPWCARGRDFAVATVLAVHGSAPRQPGSTLAVDRDGIALGSVSGGCVEGAVYALCQEALATGTARTERFAASDQDPFAVGLTCGGAIDILVTPVTADTPHRSALSTALATAAQGGPIALARVVSGAPALLGRALAVRPDGSYCGSLSGGGPDAALDRAAATAAVGMLRSGRTATVELPAECVLDAGPGGTPERDGRPLTLLVETSAPAPRMLVFGAVDFAAALVRVGTFLGYRVTVCDARPVFATAARFPDADEVVVEWPHRYLDAVAEELDPRTALCVLTHDAKFDVPLLERALRLPVGYVGAMGSRRTHEDRLERLRAVGVTERELARLRAPIGLDLGARTPQETALSIAAEIVASRGGGSGLPLTGIRTPIHHEVASAAPPRGTVP